jgi:hypothetical protein
MARRERNERDGGGFVRGLGGGGEGDYRANMGACPPAAHTREGEGEGWGGGTWVQPSLGVQAHTHGVGVAPQLGNAGGGGAASGSERFAHQRVQAAVA